MRTACLFCALIIMWNLSAQNSIGPAGTNTDTNWFEYFRPEFNSHATDFSAVPFGNGFVFSSSRSDDLSVRYFSYDTQDPLLDLYYVGFAENKFGKPIPFSNDINTRSSNEGIVTFSGDGSSAVFTGNMAGKKSLTLLGSVKEGDGWSKCKQLPFCKGDDNYAHACYASSDSMLYFVSDRPGGFGGMDIYFVRKTIIGWSEPVNAGEKINSASNELFPFCSAAGVLYFSSNRQGGSGGLDIYAIAIADTAFSEVQILAEPINCPADDFGFYISPDNSEGFFSSNRNNAKSDDDIYFFRYKWQEMTKADTIVPVDLCYGFFEEATNRTHDTAMMKYIWHFSDGDVRYGSSFDKCFDTTGAFTVRLTVRDSSGGDVILSETGFELQITQPNYAAVDVPDTVQVHEAFSIGARMYDPETYEVRSIYYESGNYSGGTGSDLLHAYHHKGTFYIRAYLLLRNKETDATESRCVVKKIIVN
jgi:hypothetical protein